MYKLNCVVQTYAWGKRGVDSLVANLKAKHDRSFNIDPQKPYAELWMGTHPNGPSMIVCKEDDDDNDNRNESARGRRIDEDLAFLFKVLSVNQALSIQAHPNKQLAKVLHAQQPSNYPDDNHKPEMLIALNDFEALCGFRPSEHIYMAFKHVPELTALCNQSNTDAFCTAYEQDMLGNSARLIGLLKQCFEQMMQRDADFVQRAFFDYQTRVNNNNSQDGPEWLANDLNALFMRLNRQYPNDIGCFSIFLLNYIKLKANEAIYLDANIPHAYLYGDGIECMACSDNVVRAGLTPKYKDVSTLVNMLDYTMQMPRLVDQTSASSHVHLYAPRSCTDFAVERIQVNKSDLLTKPGDNDPDGPVRVHLDAHVSASILIVIDNRVEMARVDTKSDSFSPHSGFVFYIDKNTELSISFPRVHGPIDNEQHTDCLFLAFRAFSKN